jgi:hypothetical protein
MTHVTKYTNSLRNYAIAVASAHVVALGWLYPNVLMFIVVPPAIFYLLFLYCELMYEIEVGYRQKLLEKIREAEDDVTRDVLTWELILHEEHSLFGNASNDRLGF